MHLTFVSFRDLTCNDYSGMLGAILYCPLLLHTHRLQSLDGRGDDVAELCQLPARPSNLFVHEPTSPGQIPGPV